MPKGGVANRLAAAVPPIDRRPQGRSGLNWVVMGGVGVERIAVGVLAAALLVLAGGASRASAEALSPWWGVSTGSRPTSLASGATGQIVVTAENRGDAPTSGEVTIVDRLPAGLEASAIEGVAGTRNGTGNRGPVSCVLETLTCTFGGVETTNSSDEEVPESLRPYEQIEVRIAVHISQGAQGENTVTVSGGGASAASASHAIEVGGRERFGIEDFEVVPENTGGSVDTQAGSHPFQLTSVLTLNTTTPEPGGGPRTVELAKDLLSELPAGLIADPAPIARCSEAQFNTQTAQGNACQAQSAVGVATLTVNESRLGGLDTVTAPIFNVQPLPGQPARFGIKALGLLSAYLETSVRSGGDYGVTLAVNDITQTVWLLGMKLTFWGTPGDARHDDQRGWECLEGSSTCASTVEAGVLPFLTLPTSCASTSPARLEGDYWEQESGGLSPLASYPMPTLEGCGLLPFAPGLEAAPATRQASSPSMFDLDVQLPQEGEKNPEGVAGSAIRDITVQLPEGVELNPAVAGGLAACSQALVGFAGFTQFDPAFEPGVQTPVFTGTLPEPLQPGVNFCPNESKLGSVKITTPLLASPLEGGVYLASPQSLRAGPSENPFRSLLAVYLVAGEPVSGVLVKLAGTLTPNRATGRLTATFEQMPQLPLQGIELDFFGGERAPLSTPARCGTYTTRASFVPWSGGETVDSSSSFQIDSGSNGGPCPGSSLPYAPSLTAQTTSVEAGAFTPLTASVGREDGQQAIESVKLKLPPGLTANVAGVRPCGEAQANAGTCPPESEIGATTFSVGLGDDPYTISGGKVYLTEGYENAPFGLALVTPARVGPFELLEGRPIVVRARLEIDPQTAVLTIATGAIPTMIEGIPLQLEHLNIAIDRPGFILNPTSCDPMRIEGAIGGSEGALASAFTHFQVADCAGLSFKPKLTAITRANGEFQGHGASLHVAIQSPSGGANLRSLKLDLPQRLPARLATVQQACPEAVFHANPAACPKASVVGSASVVTPVLAGLLSGPAYLVAKGAPGDSGGAGARGRVSGAAGDPEAAFPDLVLVLQGDGVKIDLTGGLYVSAQNITSATFRALPDVPIRRLDLVLPEGSRSILTASSALCTKRPLRMLSAIAGQNGAMVKPTVKVGVEGCQRKKPKRRKAKRGDRGPRNRL